MNPRSALLRLLPRRVRERLIRGYLKIDDEALRGLKAKIAATPSEIEGAARLVHDAYVARGILAPQESQVRMTPHLAIPSTLTVVVKKDEEIIGTLSLIIDSPLRLPMESIYPEPLARLRARKRTVAEIGAMAIAPAHRRMGLHYLLIKTLLRYLFEQLSVDDIVMAVHPSAEDIYRALFLFERVGPVRSYPSLKKEALAVALHVDLRTLRANLFRAFGHLPKNSTNPYYLFCEREDPQIDMGVEPSAPATVAAQQNARRRLVARQEDFGCELTQTRLQYLWSVLSPSAGQADRPQP